MSKKIPDIETNRPSPKVKDERMGLMEKKCSQCGAPFVCEMETGSCWCGSVSLSKEKLAQLKDQFNDCLCSSCLLSHEQKNVAELYTKNTNTD